MHLGWCLQSSDASLVVPPRAYPRGFARSHRPAPLRPLMPPGSGHFVRKLSWVEKQGDLAWLEFFFVAWFLEWFSLPNFNILNLYINCINCINLASSRYFTIPASLSPFSSAIHWRTMSSVPPNVSTLISVLVPCLVFFPK